MSEPESPVSDAALTPNDTVVGGLKPPVAAGIAVVFTIISGIIFLVLEKRNKFVRFWAMQAVLLGAVAFGLAIVFMVAHLVLGHLPLIGGLMGVLLGLLHWVCQIGWLVLYILCIIKAFTGKEWEIPWLGKIARVQLARMDRTDVPVV